MNNGIDDEEDIRSSRVSRNGVSIGLGHEWTCGARGNLCHDDWSWLWNKHTERLSSCTKQRQQAGPPIAGKNRKPDLADNGMDRWNRNAAKRELVLPKKGPGLHTAQRPVSDLYS